MASIDTIKKAQSIKLGYEEGVDKVIKSFTEPDVFVYSKAGYHANIINDKFVQGGSSFKKHFTIPFDQELRANGLAKHWGVSGEEILSIWQAKGKSTAEFGTGLHKILELDNNDEPWGDRIQELVGKPLKALRKRYMAHLDIGERIYKASKSAEENYAKPTHLDIRRMMKMQDEEVDTYVKEIIREFHELNKEVGYSDYKALAEEYVTYAALGMGGEVDRLLIIDREDKRCRVQDYKFKDKVMDKLDSNNKLINELEKSKASENDIVRIQLSFYAYCLEKAGWTVEGGDVFSRNGEWKHYPIDLIPHEEMDVLVHKYLG